MSRQGLSAPRRGPGLGVVYVIGSMGLGGAEQHLLRVASALRRCGYATEVFALDLDGPLALAFADAQVPLHGIRLPQWLQERLPWPRVAARIRIALSVPALWWLYWRRRPQVLHFFLPIAYLVGALTALFGPRTVRIMSRRSLNDYQARRPLLARLERKLHAQMDVVCGNSRAVLAQLVDEGIAPERLRLIYNGVDLERFRNPRNRHEVRRELGVGGASLVFLSVANLIPYKGHADLLQALAQAAPALPADWWLICAGRDDGIGAALRAQAGRLGLAAHILWLGSRLDVPDLLAAADIGVLCSHQEGFSNAVLEGMAAALPMLVTDVGGNAEAVQHGHTGWVVPARNPDALAAALLAAAREPQRERMGRNGRERAEQLFSLQACVAAYEQLYAAACAARPCAE